MSTSKYSQLVENFSDSSIECLDSWEYSLGSPNIKLKINEDCLIEIKILYQAPAASLDYLSVNKDELIEIKATYEILNSTLKPPPVKNTWTPPANYKNQILYIKDLPRGDIHLDIYKDSDKVYSAYFSSKGQLWGNQVSTCCSTLALGLAQGICSKNNYLLVSLLAGITNISPKESKLLPIKIFKNNLDNLLVEEPKYNIESNLELGILMLKTLYLFKQASPAVQLDLNLLEKSIVNFLINLANNVSAALDPKTGLVFGYLEGKLYSKPSYLATALSLILWCELLHNYKKDFLYLQSIYYAYEKWELNTYNPAIATIEEFNLAQTLVKKYASAEYVVPIYLDILVKEPLTIFDLGIFYTDTELSINSISLPKAATSYSLVSTFKEIKLLENILFAQTIYSMPEGYMWPSHEKLLSKFSVIGSIYRAVCSTLALNAYYYKLVKNFVISPGFFSDSGSLWNFLFDRPNETPKSYWSTWLHYFNSRPKRGLSRIDWAAYYSGFRKFTAEVYEYQYLKYPVNKVISNYPELKSIDLKTGVDLNLKTNDIALDSKLEDYVEASQQINKLNTLSDITDIESQTNTVYITGVGKPKALRKCLEDSVTPGVICYVSHITTAYIGIKKQLNTKKTSIYFN